MPDPARLIAALLMAVLLAFGGGAASAQPVTAGGMAQVAMHTATYRLSLAGTKGSSPIVGVDGTMSFAWADACDGWTIAQKFTMRLLYAEGQDGTMSTDYASWESKDGGQYRFTIRNLVDGEVEEDLRGDATMAGADGGTARFQKPETKTVRLPPGTLFPTAHTLRLIEAAQAGEVFFGSGLFDGSELEGATGVGAVVSPRQPLTGPTAEALKRASGGLARTEAWPITLAFFPADRREALPDYETRMIMLDNGIVTSMVIDYGDFRVRAELETVEPAAAVACR